MPLTIHTWSISFRCFRLLWRYCRHILTQLLFSSQIKSTELHTMYIHVCLCIPRSGRGLNLKKKLTHPSGKKKYEKEFFLKKVLIFFPTKVQTHCLFPFSWKLVNHWPFTDRLLFCVSYRVAYRARLLSATRHDR